MISQKALALIIKTALAICYDETQRHPDLYLEFADVVECQHYKIECLKEEHRNGIKLGPKNMLRSKCETGEL